MNVFRCKSCLNLSTRPRIEFNENGVCNACQWAEEKRTTVNWESRQKQLIELLDKYRGKTDFDCIVPVSGGKDSSYVAYMLKHVHHMNPLCVTVKPPLAYEIGEENIRNFTSFGYDLLSCTPNPIIMQKINKLGLVEYGIPMLGWQLTIQAYIPKLAVNLGIPLIFYGEDGEVEYGGTSKSKNQMAYDVEYSKNVYLAGTMDSVLNKNFTDKELAMFSYPSDSEIKKNNVVMTHWSFFESWDSMRNFEIASKYCGLKTRPHYLKSGSYSNIGQNDTSLFDLHTYLMFLKFGFGRANQDAGIDIRRGKMTRDEGIELVKQHDHWAPEPYYEEYCKYYEITLEELQTIFDKFANKELLHKISGKWIHKKHIF